MVLGVSSDGLDSHVKFKTKYNLPFTLLVDADHRIAKAYGVWNRGSLIGLLISGTVRSHFVIDENGRILEAQYNVSSSESAEMATQVLGKTSQNRP